MKRKSFVGLSLTLLATAAIAGTVSSVPVSVTVNADLSGSAYGNLASARQSADSQQFIGCSIQRAANPTTGIVTAGGYCQARNASGTMGFCSTTDATLLDAVQGIADYSYVSFAWRADGTCTRINVSTQSFYIP
jgi:hypothetical protein